MGGGKARRQIAVVAWVIVVGMVGRAEAGLTVYTTATSFDAATTHLTSINFNGIASPTSFVNFPNPPGYTDAATGTNFSFPAEGGTDVNITGRDFYSPTPTFPDDFLVGAGNVPQGASELITLPTGATAFSLMFSTFNGVPFTFAFSNGDSYTDTTTPAFGSVAFIGFTDTSPFTSVTLTGPGDLAINLIVQYGSAVPEPSTLTMLGLASVIVGGSLWRRRAAA